MQNLADRTQFESTYRELAPLALRAAESVLGDRAAAEDVVQELFLQLWRKPRSFDPARGTLRAYVVMLARSRALDRWRSRAAGDSARARLAGEVRVAARASEDAAEQVVLGRDSRRRLLSAVGE